MLWRENQVPDFRAWKSGRLVVRAIAVACRAAGGNGAADHAPCPAAAAVAIDRSRADVGHHDRVRRTVGNRLDLECVIGPHHAGGGQAEIEVLPLGREDIVVWPGIGRVIATGPYTAGVGAGTEGDPGKRIRRTDVDRYNLDGDDAPTLIVRAARASGLYPVLVVLDAGRDRVVKGRLFDEGQDRDRPG